MKSGLEGRNNYIGQERTDSGCTRLNEVRPGRPEQYNDGPLTFYYFIVSMKSGLEGRNNSGPASKEIHDQKSQ